MSAAESLQNPILNSPYEPPARHLVLGPRGPTGEVSVGRRPSESFIPVPVGRRRRGGTKAEPEPEQDAFDFDVTGERREVNSLINDIRSRVDRWRAFAYPGVTPVTRKLLQHWADPVREDRVLFCQREAAETAIYLAESAGRRGEPDFRARVDAENHPQRGTAPRRGSRWRPSLARRSSWPCSSPGRRPTRRSAPATPASPTASWSSPPASPSATACGCSCPPTPPTTTASAIWSARPLAHPGRRVHLHHQLPHVPAPRCQGDPGVAGNTRNLLNAGKKVDPFRETPEVMVERVLRDLAGRGRGEIVVLNDEAHHCYQDRPLESGPLDAEAKERNEGARVWFRGVRAVARKAGVKVINDCGDEVVKVLDA